MTVVDLVTYRRKRLMQEQEREAISISEQELAATAYSVFVNPQPGLMDELLVQARRKLRYTESAAAHFGIATYQLLNDKDTYGHVEQVLDLRGDEHNYLIASAALILNTHHTRRALPTLERIMQEIITFLPQEQKAVDYAMSIGQNYFDIPGEVTSARCDWVRRKA